MKSNVYDYLITQFLYREDDVRLDTHLNCWDIGWYQIKIMLEQFYKTKYKDFYNTIFKKYEERMRKDLYKFEFLKK